MKQYSQRDPRWKNRNLGTCSVTIGQQGCAVTCVSMILEVRPDEVNDILKTSSGYVRGCEMNWPKLPSIFKLEWHGRSSKAKFYPTIAEVEVPVGQHFVIDLGGGYIIDPWIGASGKNPYKILSYRNLRLKAGEEDKLKRKHFGDVFGWTDPKRKHLWAQIKDPKVFLEEFGGKVNFRLIHPNDLNKKMNLKCEKQFKKELNKVEKQYNKEVLELRKRIEKKLIEISDLETLYNQCKNSLDMKDEKPIPELPTRSFWQKFRDWLNKKRT